MTHKHLAALLLLFAPFAVKSQQKDSASVREIREVVVNAGNSLRKLNSADLGVEQVQLTEMRKLPSLFGERDIIRQLQLLPGVKAEGEASSGFQVRGGRAGQNNILLDDATVYNAGHMMGVFSTFNDEVVGTARLYKGTPPAQFGGGSSSVLNVTTKLGKPEFGMAGTIGLLSAKLCADIPISNRVTAFVAARRTYFDMFLKAVKKYRGTTMNFYDLNARVNYSISSHDRLFVSFFRGQDNMGMDDMMQTDWGNMLGNVSYWHDFNDHHYMNTSVFLSTFSFDADAEIEDIDFTYGSAIKHAGLKQSFAWTPLQDLTISYGLQSRYVYLVSLDIERQKLHQRECRSAWENELWVGADWKPVKRLTLNAGVRLNLFSSLGGSPYFDLDAEGNILHTYNYGSGHIVHTHVTPEPRVSLGYKTSEWNSVKVGFARLSQNIRPLYNNGMSSTFNRYTMSSNNIRPEIANQVSVGFTQLLGKGAYELTAEAYYKSLDNVLDYRDGKALGSEVEAERIVLGGEGRSYGLELLARKNSGRLTGWASYTLSWTENKIPGINEGRWYTASNDRRHDVSIAVMYDINKHWQASATWTYLSGQAMTAPCAKYDINGETIYFYNERNGYRAPAYHRLDLSATYKRQHTTRRGRKWESEWAFGVYNAYHRYNPYVISFKNNSNRPTGTAATLTALFGILPSVSYNFRF